MLSEIVLSCCRGWVLSAKVLVNLEAGNRVAFILLVCSVMACDLSAQSLSFKHYSGNDVLPSSNVYTSHQDKTGLIWFATDRGVCRYDGYKFVTYTIKDGLSDNEILDLFEDSSGRLWFQTLNGKLSYYKDGEFFNSVKDSLLRDLVANSFITGITEDVEGNIWIAAGSAGVISYLKNGKVQRFLHDEMARDKVGGVMSISSLREKSIQVVAGGGVFDILFNKDVDDIIQVKELESDAAPLSFSKCTRPSTDEIIFCTDNRVYSHNIKSGEVNLLYKSNREFARLFNVASDDDYIWICTAQGAIPYSRKNKALLPAILTEYQVSSVRKDREGNYWFTTLNDGVFFCTSLAIYSYTERDGLPTNRVTCLATDNANRVWIGYKVSASVSYIHHGVVYSKKINAAPIFKVYRIRFSGHRCWIGTSHGLFLIEDQLIKRMPGPTVRDIIEYPANILWHGDGYNLYQMTRKTFDYLTTQDQSQHFFHAKIIAPNVRTKAFFVDKSSTLWISTQTDLKKYAGDSLHSINLGILGPFMPVVDFAELANGTLVFATEGQGVLLFQNNSLVLHLNETHGLSSGICTAVSVDNDGTIWVGTNEGLNKISGYPGKITVERFTQADGLLAKEVSDILTEGDTVWVATASGLNFFDKNRIQKKKLPPRMFVNSLTTNGKPVKLRSRENYSFPHNENDITILYTGVSYSSGGDILYRYKLHAEDRWRYTKSTSVNLPELPADHYEFLVAAKGSNGTWSKEASLFFTVEKPFWKTHVFLFLSVIGFASAVWAASAYYFRHQKRKIALQHKVTLSELRTLRSQMNPHFLFNALNSIQGIVLKNKSEIASDYLGKFGKLMRQILDHSDKTTITIAEEIASIQNYLEIEHLRAGHFQYTIEVDPQIDIHTAEIPAMILQPFIENAIWHGFADPDNDNILSIRFTQDEEKKIRVVIADNGIGRKRSAERNNRKAHRSKGIQLVRERIDILNLTATQKIQLEIKDLEDEQGNHPGTSITIKIPSHA